MDNKNQKTLHILLKKNLLEFDNKIQNMDYFSKFSSHNLPLISYVGHLRALTIIYGTLEYQIQNAENAEIKNLFVDYIPKLPLLLEDLEFFREKEIKDIMPSISFALHIADNIILNSVVNFYKLIAYFYVIEYLLYEKYMSNEDVSQTFNLKGSDGIKYLSSTEGKYSDFWKNFTEKLDSLTDDFKIREDIISAAIEIYKDLMNIFNYLFAFDEKMLENHITSYNPEAGNFSIPTNPLEINAAISSGVNIWYEYPYYEKRYGERGRRFTVSDSVWLVTLSELPEEFAINQVNWLAKFLAKRGMPTCTMELQMQEMYQNLSILIPEDESKYLIFKKCAMEIKIMRNKFINDSDFEKCNSIFEKYFLEFNISEQICVEMKRNVGKLIASAIVDEKNGIQEAQNSLFNWILNKDIFPENWIHAVDKSIKEIEIVINR